MAAEYQMSIAERRGNGELKNFTIMTLKSAWDAWVFFGPFAPTRFHLGSG